MVNLRDSASTDCHPHFQSFPAAYLQASFIPTDRCGGNAVSATSAYTGGGNIPFSQRAARKRRSVSGPRRPSPLDEKTPQRIFIAIIL